MVEANPEIPQSIEASRIRKVDIYEYIEDQSNELGRSNTVVYKAKYWDIYSASICQVALKIFEEPNSNPSMINEMRFAEQQKYEREFTGISNDRIVEYIGWNPNALEQTEGKQIGYIAQSLNQSRNMHQLIDFQSKTTPFSEPISRNLFQKLFEAVCYTHSNHVQNMQGVNLPKAAYCHRDLKLSNVTFNDSCELVLIDFGYATPLPFNLATQDPLYVCGTPGYIAPEVTIPNMPLNGVAIDLFALGICLFFMCEGELPFFGGDSPVSDWRYQLLMQGQYEEFWAQHASSQK